MVVGSQARDERGFRKESLQHPKRDSSHVEDDRGSAEAATLFHSPFADFGNHDDELRNLWAEAALPRERICEGRMVAVEP